MRIIIAVIADNAWIGVMQMSKDISTIFTKEKNERCGRKGYFGFKREKETVITPKDYGMFLQKRKYKK